MNTTISPFAKYIAIALSIGIVLGFIFDSPKTETVTVEKPVEKIVEKIVDRPIVSKIQLDQTEACQDVIKIDERALGIASNIMSLFGEAITAITYDDMAAINRITNTINGYNAQLTSLTVEKEAIIGNCMADGV